MSLVVGFMSSVGGTGKSSLAAIAARAVGRRGHQTVLADIHPTNPDQLTKLAWLLDRIPGKAPDIMQDAWVQHYWHDADSGLFFVPGVEAIGERERVALAGATERLVSRSRDRCDFVMLDMPALEPDEYSARVLRCLDVLVFAVSQKRTSVDHARTMLDELFRPNGSSGLPRVDRNAVRIVFVESTSDVRSADRKYAAEMAQMTGVRIMAQLGYSRRIWQAENDRTDPLAKLPRSVRRGITDLAAGLEASATLRAERRSAASEAVTEEFMAQAATLADQADRVDDNQAAVPWDPPLPSAETGGGAAAALQEAPTLDEGAVPDDAEREADPVTDPPDGTPTATVLPWEAAEVVDDAVYRVEIFTRDTPTLSGPSAPSTGQLRVLSVLSIAEQAMSKEQIGEIVGKSASTVRRYFAELPGDPPAVTGEGVYSLAPTVSSDAQDLVTAVEHDARGVRTGLDSVRELMRVLSRLGGPAFGAGAKAWSFADERFGLAALSPRESACVLVDKTALQLVDRAESLGVDESVWAQTWALLLEVEDRVRPSDPNPLLSQAARAITASAPGRGRSSMRVRLAHRLGAGMPIDDELLSRFIDE